MDRLELANDFQFDQVHRLNAKPNSPEVAHCTFFKDKVKILKAKRKLLGTNVFIGENFSSCVREVRRWSDPHLKKARSENKKCMMVFNHLIVKARYLEKQKSIGSFDPYEVVSKKLSSDEKTLPPVVYEDIVDYLWYRKAN